MLYLRPLVTDISSCLIPSTCNSLRSYLPLVIVCIFFGQRLCFFKLVSVLDTQTYRALRSELFLKKILSLGNSYHFLIAQVEH